MAQSTHSARAVQFETLEVVRQRRLIDHNFCGAEVYASLRIVKFSDGRHRSILSD